MKPTIPSLPLFPILTRLTLLLAFSAISFAQEPRLEVFIRTEEPRVNRPFKVEYEVRWDGLPGQFAILGPEVDPFDWGNARIAGASSRVDGDVMVIVQTIEYTAEKEGDFELPQVRIAYFDPHDAPPEGLEKDPAQAEQAQHPYLRAASFPLSIRPEASYISFSGGMGIILVVCTLTILALYRLRRKPAVASTSPESVFSTIQDGIHLAKRKRLDGDFYEFFVALTGVAASLGADEGVAALRERLTNQAKEVGFKNLRPTDDEMDGALRELERFVAKRRKQEL